MIDAKQQVITSIVQARSSLEAALADLEKLPAFDPSSVPFAAHALSNFLTVSEGTIDLLLGSQGADTDAETIRLLTGLRHATSLMTRTVSQLMTNSSVGKFKFRFEKIDLSHLVQRACEYYQRIGLQKSIRIFFDDTGDTPLVWSDRVAIAAILDNLLSNAVKYSPIGKSVTVSVKIVGVDAVCSVQDRGPGISTFDQNRLFQSGVTLSAVPTGGEPSSGYGLAVAKELVDQLGGAIWVESAPGKGARFSFRLPTISDEQQTDVST
jgi:signal transduction histidine kinase